MKGCQGNDKKMKKTSRNVETKGKWRTFKDMTRRVNSRSRATKGPGNQKNKKWKAIERAGKCNGLEGNDKKITQKSRPEDMKRAWRDLQANERKIKGCSRRWKKDKKTSEMTGSDGRTWSAGVFTGCSGFRVSWLGLVPHMPCAVPVSQSCVDNLKKVQWSILNGEASGPSSKQLRLRETE